MLPSVQTMCTSFILAIRVPRSGITGLDALPPAARTQAFNLVDRHLWLIADDRARHGLQSIERAIETHGETTGYRKKTWPA